LKTHLRSRREAASLLFASQCAPASAAESRFFLASSMR
jgi:hypothetical protein